MLDSYSVLIALHCYPVENYGPDFILSRDLNLSSYQARSKLQLYNHPCKYGLEAARESIECLSSFDRRSTRLPTALLIVFHLKNVDESVGLGSNYNHRLYIAALSALRKCRHRDYPITVTPIRTIAWEQFA